MTGELLTKVVRSPCVSCHARPVSATGFCQICYDKITHVPDNLCAVCGAPLGFEYEIDTMETYLCGECTEESPPFDALRYALEYSGPVREMMLAFKFKGQRSLATPLFELGKERIAPWLETFDDAVILPTPLAAGRLYSRGFNPSYLLAKKFGALVGIDVEEGVMRRVKRTAPQYGLNSQERIKNVQGAFKVKQPERVKGRTVILFDDIYTTGATVAECCKAIKKAKPEKVVVAALCRTVME